MRRKAFIIGVFFLVATLGVDSMFFFSQLPILGIFSTIGTALVFSSAIIWFIYRDDQKMRLKNIFSLLPLGLFALAFWKVLKQVGVDYQIAPEDLLGVGNLMMSRYEVGLWLISVMILFAFVLAGSLLVRRSQ